MSNIAPGIFQPLQVSQQNPIKIGAVTALFANDSPQITFDGETTASEKQYAYLASYTPTVGDRVLLAIISGTYVVLGKIVYSS